MARIPRSLWTVVAAGALVLGVGGVALTATAAAADPLISQNKPVKTSSNENTTLTGPKAVDGNTSTRWGSLEGKDPQWIRIDLGASFHLSRVVLRWEAAFGKAYQIQVSEDDTNWMDAFTTTTGNGGVDDLALDTNGRYVRMFGTRRGSPYGYSLFEFEVYGTNGGPVDRQPPTVPANFRQVGAATPTQIDVAWDAATDNVGVQLYEVYNGGTKIKTVGGNQLATSLTNLTPNTDYSLTVLARDAAGNPSQSSNALNIHTPKSDDTTPPSVPVNVHGQGQGRQRQRLGRERADHREDHGWRRRWRRPGLRPAGHPARPALGHRLPARQHGAGHRAGPVRGGPGDPGRAEEGHRQGTRRGQHQR